MNYDARTLRACNKTWVYMKFAHIKMQPIVRNAS